MFTGIIEEIGHIKFIKKGTKSEILRISANTVLNGSKIGDSICVNGVCLTITSMGHDTFDADVMHETLNRSNLSELMTGSCVNLERAMANDGRFGGHIVSGHIDGCGVIDDIRKDDNAYWYRIRAPKEIMKYIVMKGSITIDGISLTVADVTNDSFSVSIIPHTRANTIFRKKRRGDKVNLENDIIGKYVEKFINKTKDSGVTYETLTKYGFN